MDHASQLVVVEGIDGSGKGTQAARLVTALESAGLRAALISFPRYEKTFFGARVGDFLNGRFGNLDQLHPFLVSLLYAGDRAESLGELRWLLSENDVVVCDRYVTSNLAHQGAKAPAGERAELWRWIEYVEYELNSMPLPDHVFWLKLSVPTARRLISRKSDRNYTDRAADLQEADEDHLGAAHEAYATLAARGRWHVLDCEPGGVLKPIEVIASELFDEVVRSCGITLRESE